MTNLLGISTQVNVHSKGYLNIYDEIVVQEAGRLFVLEWLTRVNATSNGVRATADREGFLVNSPTALLRHWRDAHGDGVGEQYHQCHYTFSPPELEPHYQALLTAAAL